MPPFLHTYRAVVWTAILLLGALLGTSTAGYFAAKTALQQDLAERALPLAGDHVHAALQADLQRSAVIASMMANDSFVRDWLRNGESDTEPMARYLAEIRQQHGASRVFLVSERSRNYYDAGSTPRALQENDAQESWYFRLKEAQTPFIAEFNAGQGNPNTTTIFIRYRMLDRDGSFLGVAGVDLKAASLGESIDGIQRRFGSRIYFLDAQGKPVLSGSGAPNIAGLGGIMRQLLHKGSQPAWFEYGRDGERIQVSARFVPEADWHLLVEQDTVAVLGPLRHAFLLHLAIGMGIATLALAIMLFTVRHHRKQLNRMAGSDALTSLLNRQAFDLVFHHARLDAERTGRPLSGILFDIDFLKQINENHGYQTGDKLLRKIAQLARGTLRENDVIARWGGEEFMVLLKECSLEQAAAVAEKLRESIDQYDFSAIVPDRHVTISLGVACNEMQETSWAFFSRLEDALSKAKSNGRNRLQVAPSLNEGNTVSVVA